MKYKVYFVEETFNKAVFEADNLEEAKTLLEKVTDAEIYMEELPKLVREEVSFAFEIEMNTLEREED